LSVSAKHNKKIDIRFPLCVRIVFTSASTEKANKMDGSGDNAKNTLIPAAVYSYLKETCGEAADLFKKKLKGVSACVNQRFNRAIT
jgi:hypothetical protein